MPTKERIEDDIIEGLLSAYEDGAWADAEISWPDKVVDAGVDAIAVRASDKKILAIEHTIVQPFPNEKKNFALLLKSGFLELDKDLSLRHKNRWIQVFIPIGDLHRQIKQDAKGMVIAVRGCLQNSLSSAPEGYSEITCHVASAGEIPAFDITLTVRVVPLTSDGELQVGLQQTGGDLVEVIEKALVDKLPKLTKTSADKRVLLLERQHMNLHPNQIIDEIEGMKGKFNLLNEVDEIWIVETMFFKAESALYFDLRKNGLVVDGFPVFL